MKIRKVNITTIICIMMVTISGCGSSDITGQYQGKDADGILCINADETWSYEQEGDWGSSDIYWEGTYRKDKGDTYILECEDIILYTEPTSEDILFVYANSSKWGDEDFKKIYTTYEGDE